jgi:2-methylisocitrate lyase-like PEP mutase family enzyme
VPLNILGGPHAPGVAELAALGVARVSLGSSIAEAAYAVVRDATRELLTLGTSTTLAGGVAYAGLNALVGRPA